MKRKKQLAESLKSDLKFTHTHWVIVEELGHTLWRSVILERPVLGGCEGLLLGVC